MMKSMQKSLDYYTKNFGPYAHKQARIIEFPRVASFAQAFPGEPIGPATVGKALAVFERTLVAVDTADDDTIAVTAVWFDDVRLIDNGRVVGDG